MHPFLTNEPVNAQFTALPSTICQGEQIVFDAAGSTYQDTLLWDLPGSTPPGYVSEDPNPTVTFDQPGVHTITMYVVGGGCSELDSAQTTVTVNPTPTISATAVTNPICNGGNTNITASGASTYVWSPAGTLSASTGPTVNAFPTVTTTYNIAGTTGGCTGNTSIEIEVLDPPTAVATQDIDTVDCNFTVLYDGSNSTDVTTFAWTYNSGTPGTSNASGDLVQYNTPGDFTSQMIVTNSCGSDTTSFTIHVNNNCGAGIGGFENGITGYYS